MGGRSSVQLQESEIQDIQKDTGFSRNQILRLYSRFTNLDKSNNGFLRREDFLRIPELAINPLGDRIVHSFFSHSDNDYVNFPQFVKILARFRPVAKNKDNKLNSREEKLRFAFRMYDLDGDDKVSKDELVKILHMMVGSNISDEQLCSIADRTVKEVDLDKDDVISFEEFSKAMEKVDVESRMSIRFLH